MHGVPQLRESVDVCSMKILCVSCGYCLACPCMEKRELRMARLGGRFSLLVRRLVAALLFLADHTVLLHQDGNYICHAGLLSFLSS